MQDTSAFVDTLIKNWNSGFSALNKRKASGQLVGAEDVRKNVIAAGQIIYEHGLNPTTVAESGHKVRQFNDIFNRVQKARMPLKEAAPGLSDTNVEVNPIQLAAIQSNPGEANSIITSIKVDPQFNPITPTELSTSAGGNFSSSENTGLANGSAMYDVQKKAKEVSVDLLKNTSLSGSSVTSISSSDSNTLATGPATIAPTEPKPDVGWKIPKTVGSSTPLETPPVSLMSQDAKFSGGTKDAVGLFGSDKSTNATLNPAGDSETQVKIDHFFNLSEQQKNKLSAWTESDQQKGFVPTPPAAINLRQLNSGANGTANLKDGTNAFGGNTTGESMVVSAPAKN